jgi:hypothetical protein
MKANPRERLGGPECIALLSSMLKGYSGDRRPAVVQS